MALELVLVRHGQSVGNVARDRAEAAGAEAIEVAQRDADVPLSELGSHQAAALGRWLREPGNVPTSVWCSPYLRARQTAAVALGQAGLDLPVRVDERLRDRELGVLDLLTSRGVATRFPAEAQRRRWVGKMYYRPPGGESWCDIALRLRSFVSDLRSNSSTDRRLIVTHDAVIVMFRFVCEQLYEDDLYAIARQGSITNTSVTRLEYVADNRPWVLNSFNTDDHLLEVGVPAPDPVREAVPLDGGGSVG
jgi:probable phosphoglycerate mutase